MDSIGAEVGQKMRSAIKAKLMELDCYVDDELPDYIMVMVANRRTKSQMNEDLNLFLSTKTSAFVNWLHIVLKKLKEVTVTNPEVYKKAIKRKTTELADDKNSLKVKKEKTHKKVKKELLSDKPGEEAQESRKEFGSITDDLPISSNKMSDSRRIIVANNKINQLADCIVDDNFDIPLLSEVTDSANEQELQDIERKIRNVKSRLGILVASDNEEENVNVKPENDKSSVQSETQIQNERNTLADARQISILNDEIAGSEENRDAELKKTSLDRETSSFIEISEKKSQHKRITFDKVFDLEPSPLRSRLDRSSDRLFQAGSKDRFSDKFRDKSPVRNNPEKRPSILDRLGKRLESPERSQRSEYRQKGDRISRGRSSSRDKERLDRLLSERLGIDRRKRGNSKDRNRSRSPLRSKDRNKEREPKREGILSRVGVQSKISVIKKPIIVNQNSDDEEDLIVREVQSSIKVKPRVISNHMAQPNKNLLLKAVAEAQRSIAQTPKVGKEIKPDAVFTKKYSGKHRSSSSEQKDAAPRKLPKQGISKLKKIIKQSSGRMRSRMDPSSDEYDSEGEYIPKPVKKTEKDVPSYIPSSKSGSESELRENETKENGKQQFIITLDGIERLGFVDNKSSVKSRLDTSIKKRSPSPIVFEKAKDNNNTENKASRPDIPDKLPVVHPPLSIKIKERCRYWPGCRQGDKCEFAHPSESCQLFPHCKFGEKCLYLHPKCKFGSSCTKRECPYDHNITKTAISSKLPVAAPAMQNCKFFPNCANAKCPFYHPKPCKYGKYCKNISECGFSHALVVSKKNMSWRSK